MSFARSVRMRLTLWYATVLAVIVVLFAAGVYVQVGWSMQRHAEHQLADRLTAVEQAYRDNGDELEEIDHHGSVMYFHVAAGNSQVYQSDSWRRNQLSGAFATAPPDDAWGFRAPSGEPFLLRSRLLSDAPEPVSLTAALSQRLAHQSLRTLAFTLLVGLPIALLVAALGGYWLAGRVLAPIKAITAKAREITAERLDERLPVANPHDEFGQLASVFNDVLARLRDSFERLKRFTSDASHELRTPLTAIRSVGEVALQDNRPPGEYREVIGSMLEEADRLTRLLDSLLTLTRADHDRIAMERELVNISALTRDVAELLRSLTEERRQTLTVNAAAPLLVEADPNLLRQAIINLLDNAVKYAPPQGSIRVRAFLSTRDEVVVEGVGARFVSCFPVMPPYSEIRKRAKSMNRNQM